MAAERMFVLQCGTELVPKSLSVLGGSDKVIATPIYGVVVETSAGLVLLDTGINAAALADPAILTGISQTGTWTFAADAADLSENLFERIPCGSVAEPEDAPRASASVNLLMDGGDRLDARVIPGHDSVFWKAVWHPRDGHR
jgi:hypothetical protein